MRFDLDRAGPYQAKLPTKHDVTDIAGLAEAFVRHELSLPPEQRTLLTEPLQARLAQLQQALQDKRQGQIRATVASGRVKQVEQRARNLVRQIQRHLTAVFFERPAQATAWGFTVRQTGRRAGTLLLPIGRDALLSVLSAYIRQEQSRPAAEQFTLPVLSEVAAARTELTEQVAAFQQATALKEAGRAASVRLATEVLVHLQVALAYLMITRLDSKVTPQLQAWGFNIVERRARSKAEPAADAAGDDASANAIE